MNNILINMKQGAFLCFMFFLTLTSVSVQVNAAQITPQQIEQFKRLPLSQQQALAKSMGVDINAVRQQLQGKANTEQVVKQPIMATARASVSDKKSAPAKIKNNTLKPFGYDVFANAPSTFTPDMDIAIPEGYTIGKGDVIAIQIFGKENYDYQLPVNREGQIIIPSLGVFNVAGLSFSDLKTLLKDKIKKSIIGVDAVISLAQLRSIRVFVLGEAYKPGPYTLSSLSTITHALFAAGGINDIGSLRNIQLKRQGKLIQQLDLYELLIKGDSSSDVSLQSGDVVFVAPVGDQVTVKGEVRRAAIYELANNENFNDVITMAGGLLPSAYSKAIRVERYNKQKLRTILTINLLDYQQAQAKAMAGDVIVVNKTANMFDDAIEVIGAVARPGKYQWHDGMKINDLLPSVNSHLLANADLHYSLLVREIDLAKNIEVYQFSLADIISNKKSKNNFILQPHDKIIVFSQVNKNDDENISFNQVTTATADKKLNNIINQDITELTEDLVNNKKEGDITAFTTFSRQRLLLPIINQLKRQGASGKPIQLVEIDGQVKFPSIYPLAKNARISDLIAAAGGVTESAYLARADVTRNIVTPEGVSKKSLSVNIANALQGKPKDNLLLQSKDRLNIHKIPAWSENYTIELRGEFVFPGKYTFQRGDTLAKIIAKAGGLTDYADINASVFTRQKLKAIEQKSISKLAEDLRLEIASKSLSSSTNNLPYAEAKSLLTDLISVKPVGRLVIELEKVLQANNYDVLLEDGDVLVVPSKTNSVNVIGQVQVNTSHVYEASLSAQDYIDRSGGVKKRADVDRAYIIAANGSIRLISGTHWFANNNEQIHPGDTIVVPLDSGYMENLTLWSTATQIIYNSAVAIAAISRI